MKRFENKSQKDAVLRDNRDECRFGGANRACVGVFSGNDLLVSARSIVWRLKHNRAWIPLFTT